jgi:hypothetical protein
VGFFGAIFILLFWGISVGKDLSVGFCVDFLAIFAMYESGYEFILTVASGH